MLCPLAALGHRRERALGLCLGHAPGWVEGASLTAACRQLSLALRTAASTARAAAAAAAAASAAQRNPPPAAFVREHRAVLLHRRPSTERWVVTRITACASTAAPSHTVTLQAEMWHGSART